MLCAFQCRRQIRRQRRGDVDFRAGHRMCEGEAGRVEELAGQIVAIAGAVLKVAADGVADRGQVDADLVGSAGLEYDAEERRGREQLLDLEVGAGLARVV